ncbi:C40 family peptidase [Sungkyunkwania multivorans]|uniref:C40 family peptidase n=1 Tax=Sungkyunkwania multivorans TaxID=1173618 RepID=A0ABW3D161_9FLAO
MNTIFKPAILFIIIVALASCGGSKKALTEALEQQRRDSIALAKKNKIHPIQKKYASILNVRPEKISNIKLFEFIDGWMNTPYKLGGEDKSGIDCSFFVQYIYHDVYDVLIERTAEKQFNAPDTDRFKGQKYLRQGDLIFFNPQGSEFAPITHVGFYLGNNKFVHSTARRETTGPGVKISNLKDPYWQRLFVSAGRKPLKPEVLNSKLEP